MTCGDLETEGAAAQLMAVAERVLLYVLLRYQPTDTRGLPAAAIV
jgi:hypothetical protein